MSLLRKQLYLFIREMQSNGRLPTTSVCAESFGFAVAHLGIPAAIQQSEHICSRGSVISRASEEGRSGLKYNLFTYRIAQAIYQ